MAARLVSAAALYRNADPIVRLVVINWIFGSLMGIGCALALFAFNIAGLRALLAASDMEWIGLLLLCSGFAVTFGGVITASAIMMVPSDTPQDS
ncbi:MAG: hypothetical protein ACLP8A_01750 [Methylovirgula sp.]